MRNSVLSRYLAIGGMFLTLAGSRLSGQQIPESKKSDVKHKPSAAYRCLEIMLEAAARDVERIGAQPTILSRQMAIPVTAMYDAWAAYDEKAVGTMHGDALRRPAAERTLKNKEKAIAYAMYRTCIDQYPRFSKYLTEEMTKMGYDPADQSEDLATPKGMAIMSRGSYSSIVTVTGLINLVMNKAPTVNPIRTTRCIAR